MPFFDFHSYKIFYTDIGPRTARVITFIHGWTGSSRIYKAQLEYFSRQYRCIALDFLGHGQSDKPPVSKVPELYSHLGFQNSVLALLQFLGVEKTNLLAWSMGCPSGAEISRKYPEKVQNLVLVGYTPVFILSDPNDPFPAVPAVAGVALWDAVKNSFSDFYKTLVLSWFPEYTPGDPVPEYIQRALEDTLLVGGDIAEGVSRNVSCVDFRRGVGEIKVRTMFITGGIDSATPPAAARWAFEQWGGEKEIIVYEGLGHTPFVGANAEKFNHDVDAFFKSSTP